MLTKAKRILNFTKVALAALPVPDEQRQYHYDEKTPTLALCVTPVGTRTFYVVRRVGPAVERVKIGRWPKVSIEQARDEAARINGKAVDGVNPNDDRRADRAAPTFKVAFEEFIILPTRTKKKRIRAPKTSDEYRRQFETYLSGWGSRRVSEITREDVERLHNRMGSANGHYQANRVLALVKAILNTAVDRSYIRFNPAARIAAFEEQSRERFLGADELKRFWAAVQAETSVKVRDFVALALFTGQRRSNVLMMRWAEIDFERALWTIPRAKSGKAHEVPLSTEAVKVLERRWAERDGDSEFVLPGRTGEGTHLRDPMRQWRSILERADIGNLRLHDLRRTLASWQTASGASSAVVGKTLGHTDPAATLVYSRVNLETVRQSMDTATAAMMAAAQPKSKRTRKAKRATNA